MLLLSSSWTVLRSCVRLYHAATPRSKNRETKWRRICCTLSIESTENLPRHSLVLTTSSMRHCIVWPVSESHKSQWSLGMDSYTRLFVDSSTWNKTLCSIGTVYDAMTETVHLASRTMRSDIHGIFESETTQFDELIRRVHCSKHKRTKTQGYRYSRIVIGTTVKYGNPPIRNVK